MIQNGAIHWVRHYSSYTIDGKQPVGRETTWRVLRFHQGGWLDFGHEMILSKELVVEIGPEVTRNAQELLAALSHLDVVFPGMMCLLDHHAWTMVPEEGRARCDHCSAVASICDKCQDGCEACDGGLVIERGKWRCERWTDCSPLRQILQFQGRFCPHWKPHFNDPVADFPWSTTCSGAICHCLDPPEKVHCVLTKEGHWPFIDGQTTFLTDLVGLIGK